MPQAFHERVDLTTGRVQVEGRPSRGRDAVAQADRAGAVVSHANGDTPFVEQLTDVVGVQRPVVGPGEHERDGAAPVDRVRWPDDP